MDWSEKHDRPTEGSLFLEVKWHVQNPLALQNGKFSFSAVQILSFF